ncbi:MAG: hypothetical protein ACR2QM_04065, partial [Longimicrobiales bacterium]
MSSVRLGVCGVLLLALATVPPGAGAQQPGLSGYYLNVGTWVDEGVTGPSGVSDFQRFRLMGVKSWNDLLLDVAYEH